MPRRPNITPEQVETLLHNVAAAEEFESLGRRRLVALFPELARRLDDALKKTRAHPRNADLACRHYLTGEALVEVLEARIRDGRGRKGDARGAIVDEYSQLVPARLKDFPKRPATERRAIQEAYPEVDVQLVRRALRDGRLAPEFAAGVLEDPINYRALHLKSDSPSRRRR